MGEPQREPVDRRERGVATGVPLALIAAGVEASAIQLDRDALVLIADVDPKASSRCGDPELAFPVPQPRNVKHAEISPDLKFALATLVEHAQQVAKLAPIG